MSAQAHVADSGSRRLGSILGSRSSSLERGMNALTKALQATAAGDGTAVDDVYTATAAQTQADCDDCKEEVRKGVRRTVPKCIRAWKRAPVVSVLGGLGCTLGLFARMDLEFFKCTFGPCIIEPPPPTPVPVGNPGVPPMSGGTCPDGTHRCGDGSCCAGSDICCGCIHPTAFIQCCIVEVGCTCCPQS
jgi:hypothetical protein